MAFIYRQYISSIKFIPASNVQKTSNKLEMNGELTRYLAELSFPEAKLFVEKLFKEQGFKFEYNERTHKSVNASGHRIKAKMTRNSKKSMK